MLVCFAVLYRVSHVEHRSDFGPLASFMERPGNFVRTYDVQVEGTLSRSMIPELKRGVNIDGHVFRPVHTSILGKVNKFRSNTGKHWLEIKIKEGKVQTDQQIVGVPRLSFPSVCSAGF